MEKNILEEGGHALNGRPVRQDEVPGIVEKVNSILDSIGLEFHTDYESCGSAGKKTSDKTSGDIDFIVSRKKVIGILGLGENAGTGEILDGLKGMIEGLGYEAKSENGLNLVSFGLPFNGPDDIVQVDLMLAGSMEFARFFQGSPDYTKGESKYKNMVRNILLMTIASTVFRKTTKEVTLANGFNGPAEVEQYCVRLNDGLFKTRKNWIGKKNRLVKTKSTLHDYDELVNDTPQAFIDLFFKDTKPDDLKTFESSYDALMSERFKYPDLREKILVSAVMAYISNARKGEIPVIPDEIGDRYINLANEKIRDIEDTHNRNSKSDIVDVRTFEGTYVKSFGTFLMEMREDTITVTFKEIYMDHEVVRTCGNMSREEVISVYGLDHPDIEWYQFDGEERVFNEI